MMQLLELVCIVIVNILQFNYPHNIAKNHKNKTKGKSVEARTWYESDLIPENKFDFDAVNRLKTVSIDDIKNILPRLFEWTEDYNWPIAPELSSVLSKFQPDILPFVVYHLKHPVGIDELGVHYLIIPKLTKYSLKLIEDDLKKVACEPTEFQKEEEYDKLAEKYLDAIND